MPGPRFDGWHHLRYVGDRALAAQHLPLARKVLGFVREQAEANGLQTYKHEVPIPGGKIVGEMVGGQPRATIVVGPAQEKTRLDLVEGFILRFAEELEIDPPPDPVIFSLPREGAPDDEVGVARFYGADSFGRDETDDAVRGTYSHVFGPREKLTSQLPAGALWTSRDGEAVSWFRGFPGYWPPHYVHPGAPYGGYVAIYGNIVFVVPSTRDRVMAAAARDGYLYVWVASGLWEYPNYTPPATPSICGDIWATQPYPDMAHVFRLYRLPLKVTTDVRGVQVYKASSIEDGELLLDTPLPRAWGAWTFNRDVTKLVSIQLPEKAVLYHKAEYVPIVGSLSRPGYAPSSDEHADMPTTGALRFEVSITHNSDGAAAATFSQAPAGNVVAEEDGVVLELVQHELFLDTRDRRLQINYKCGDWELLASRTQDTWATPGEDVRTQEYNVLLAAHLPTRSFLFYHVEQHHKPAPSYVKGRYRIFRALPTGGIEEVLDVDSDPLDVSSPEVATMAFNPPTALMGTGALTVDGTAFEWFRAWDGITTLLTLTYDRSFLTILPNEGEDHHYLDTAWIAVWAKPLVAFSWGVGEHYGAGGVYFGSRDFYGPWTWYWTEGDFGPEAHIIHFNGTRINSLDAKTFNVFFGGGTAALTYDPRTSPFESLYIADAAPAAVQLTQSLGGGDPTSVISELGAKRRLRWSTRGNASAMASGLDAALPGGDRLGACVMLGHTGKPRREQRAGVETQ